MRDTVAEESAMMFDTFSNEDAWQLGSQIKHMAEERGLHVVISIERAGQLIFQYAQDGTAPDNDRWIAGKRNITNLTLHSSIAMRDSLNGASIEVLGLDTKKYMPFGGAVPLYVKGAGYIGNLVVSGSTDDEDHELAVTGIKTYLGRI